MCGIVGLLGYRDNELTTAMSDAVTHRGPDGSGQWADDEARISLAHRRLAIIDLSAAAAQPMSGVGGRYQVVFNGEIYNFVALASDLRARGYSFNQNSDTAILAPLYDLYGAAMLSRLNGIFAFAIWDQQDRELFLARDHIGAKPLYYTQERGRFAFASELKALALIPDLDRSLDETAILHYLHKLWSPGERTPFRAVKKMPAGHWMRVRLCDSGVEINKHSWSCEFGAKSTSTARAHDTKSELLRLLDEVVSDQCLSDVPLGAFLSGGVDSTALVASMVKTGHRPAQTYCIGFEGDETEQEGFGNDLVYAKIAAECLSVPLTQMWMPTPGADDFERLAYTLDEPQADPAPLYVGAISEAARADGVTVLLSGAGGDDIFSGYRRHVAAALRDRLGPARSVLGLIPEISRSDAVGRRIGRLKDLMRGDDETFLEASASFNARDLARACLTEETLQAADRDPNRFWEMALTELRGAPLAARSIRLERHGFLPEHNLNYTDKASMAHGVEVRVPFLDPRMIGFADALPLDVKVRGLEPKWVLKRALETRVPKVITRRKKTGFGGPVRAWMNGPLAPALSDIMASASFREGGVFDPVGVERVRAATASGKVDGSYVLLAVMMIEFWMKAFLLPQERTHSSVGRAEIR
jgi:asparagine synthase (glutamine-hydrolysing)